MLSPKLGGRPLWCPSDGKPFGKRLLDQGRLDPPERIEYVRVGLQHQLTIRRDENRADIKKSLRLILPFRRERDDSPTAVLKPCRLVTLPTTFSPRDQHSPQNVASRSYDAARFAALSRA